MSLKHLLLPIVVSFSLAADTTSFSFGLKIKNHGTGMYTLKTSVWTYNPKNARVPEKNNGCDFNAKFGPMIKVFHAGDEIPLGPGQSYAGEVQLKQYTYNYGDAKFVPCFLINGGALKDVYLVFYPTGPAFVPEISKSVVEVTTDSIVFH